MGLFWLFSAPSPEATALKIVARTVQIEVVHGEAMVAADLSIDISRLVSERILLRVGVAEASVAHVADETKHHEAAAVLAALRAAHSKHFQTRPGVSAGASSRVYGRAVARYMMLHPAAIAARFADQLHHPSKWDEPPEDVSVPASRVVLDYVDAQMKDIARYAFDATVAHVHRCS